MLHSFLGAIFHGEFMEVRPDFLLPAIDGKYLTPLYPVHSSVFHTALKHPHVQFENEEAQLSKNGTKKATESSLSMLARDGMHLYQYRLSLGHGKNKR